MNNLTNEFGNLYHPVKAFIVYEKKESNYENTPYVESYDLDRNGYPINAHPLTNKEANQLAKALTVTEKKQRNFLNPKGVLSPDLIFLKTGNDGFAIWRTPPQNVKLLFTDSLDIPSGRAQVPALLWKASKSSLSIFAITDECVHQKSELFHAPFFNVYADGKVCMGNVLVQIPNDCCLEDFMSLWQEYFFNSYFSHLFGQHLPVNGNIVQLWQKLVDKNEPFPFEILIPNNISINKLIQ
ncbi:MAG: PRTRC system protein B [Sphingobacteriales bacterium]